jgi:hypothetical protein
VVVDHLRRLEDLIGSGCSRPFRGKKLELFRRAKVDLPFLYVEDPSTAAGDDPRQLPGGLFQRGGWGG